MVRVSVPQYTLRGEPVELLCEFDLQGDKLYSVSWYKDHDEFYRYVPKGNPPQHTYYIDGINVDQFKSDAQKVVIRNVPLRSSGMYRCEVSAEAPASSSVHGESLNVLYTSLLLQQFKSDAQKVVIRNVPLRSSGMYRCEVSAEAPAFSSVHGESRMNVVALPQDGPEITGEERNYQVGDEINLNCTSAKSYPPARLRWYVNDQPVGPDYEAVVQQHGLMTTIAGLRFQVGPEHFHQGRLQVRCVATISTSTATPTAPAPAPVLQHQRLAASAPPPALDYNREALFFIRGVSHVARASALLLLLTSLAHVTSWLT